MTLRFGRFVLVGLLFFCLILLGVAATTQAQTILMHGADVDVTAGADAQVFAHLESLFGAGNVTYMQGDMAAADGSSADGFSAVVISSTLNSGTARNKYEDATIGVLNWEQALTRQAAGEFNLSEGGRTFTDQTQIDILDPSHPLAAGLSGTVTVFSTPHTMSLGTGALGADVSRIAAPTAATADHAILAADVGDALLGDGSNGSPAFAPGRRVMLFMEDQGFADLTPEGLALFSAAVTWVAIPEPSSIILCGVVLPLVVCVGLRRRRR